jgi:hypothetical protein
LIGGEAKLVKARAQPSSLDQQAGHRRQKPKSAENGSDDESHGKCYPGAQGQKSPWTARRPDFSTRNSAAAEQPRESL